MSLLTDPRICPDCRSPLDSAGTCTGCHLRLTGPLAAELWRTMQSADALVERLRAAVPVPATGPERPAAPPPRLETRPQRRTGLSAASVPTVLFGVGALCLLVAAVVFVAVAWSSLGLGARTTILLAVTGAFATLATRLTVRGLRGAAETFWLVVGALVTIDVAAAYAAGMVGFDAVEVRHAVACLGAGLLGLGLGVGSWVRRTGTTLVAPTVLSTAGTVLLAAGEGWAAPSTAVGCTLAVLALAGLARLARALDLRPTAYAVAAVGALSWMILLGAGVDRAGTVSTAAWWTGLDGWPLLVAALLAAAVTLVPAVAEPLRTAAATAAQLAAVLLVVGPGARPDTEILVLAALAVALAGTSLVAPRVWALPAACFAGLAGTVATGYALLRPLATVTDLPTTGPADASNLGLHVIAATGQPSPWTAIIVVATALTLALALIRWIGDPAARQTAERGWLVGAPTLALLGVVTALLESGPALVVAVLAWALVLAVLGGLAVAVRGVPAPGVLVAATYLGVVGLRLAVPSHLLAALLATGIALGLAAAYRWTVADRVTRATTGALALVAAGFAATHWPYLAGGTGDAAGLSLALVAATGGVLAVRVARDGDRTVLEATALALGLAGVAFPVDPGVTTVVLTVVGTAAALVSVLNSDRDEAAWIGTAVLGVAAIARVGSGLTLPELATAPAAALLLVAGIHRMRTDDGASSPRVLGSGLTLALLPSLLLSLDEPVSTRGALLGLVALLTLATGVSQRWAAPFLAGAAVLAVLAVRHLGPVAEALPRWISLGTTGALLLAVAVTWESRRRQLEVAERYLAALR